ncbi:ABC transporter substrate-binding protein [Cellulomonas fimi]|uniref:Extracellular solute-binding protein family 1 n=1 Tax=Cellulomonas fimi (strain ATCC 484 / DSM 20113 / JCM 1341 / CCUG 24087 / LMG 16345 / NBRC 15513 / NCIMB 8980 / NCTC 7547 / NRS-133) TaxID=590998 RepID=F4H7C8_CELFA|nr:extracellular solute-binding protein [Cellulomonas fimi]AEE46889.1 extracellular solute-binding protein family 1 [Cellulomonas fimi ATCC 484]NNH08817.1 extracellular solute-binding protein [Cellulomonas fimi]
MFPQKRRTRVLAVVTASTLLALTAACSSGGGDQEANDDGTPSGELTVLTWRTDLVEDGTFDEYVEQFKAKYPEVTDVTVEGVTDYEGTVKTRMNTEDYGDVLAIPGSVTPDQLPDFFEPLGDQAEMEKEYRWLNDKSFEGKSYGIPVVGNVQGVVYNKRVWEEAGITEFPTTPQEFLDDLQAVKDKGIAVAPLYTNYKDAWALSQWEGWRGAVTANPDYVNEMTQTDTPWTEESDSGVIDGTIYDVVAQGLTEADPTTTDWEGSKRLLGVGDISAMVLGSWSIPQMQAAAEAAGADPADIAYMPTPSQVDGKFHTVAGGDYNLGINVHSKNKATARAWIDWFNHESGFSEAQVGLSPLIDGPVPAALEGFMAEVELITMNPAPEGKESLFADIDTASGIVTTDPKYRQQIIDDARSGARTKEQIFDDLNSRWAEGRADAGA